MSELLAQSRVEPAYFVVARKGKNAFALSSSARQRAISRRSRLVSELLAQSRVEPAYFVVARKGKNAFALSSSARQRAISRRSQLQRRPRTPMSSTSSRGLYRHDRVQHVAQRSGAGRVSALA
jgi:hypothetical protein